MKLQRLAGERSQLRNSQLNTQGPPFVCSQAMIRPARVHHDRILNGLVNVRGLRAALSVDCTETPEPREYSGGSVGSVVFWHMGLTVARPAATLG